MEAELGILCILHGGGGEGYYLASWEQCSPLDVSSPL